MHTHIRSMQNRIHLLDKMQLTKLIKKTDLLKSIIIKHSPSINASKTTCAKREKHPCLVMIMDTSCESRPDIHMHVRPDLAHKLLMSSIHP